MTEKHNVVESKLLSDDYKLKEKEREESMRKQEHSQLK